MPSLLSLPDLPAELVYKLTLYLDPSTLLLLSRAYPSLTFPEETWKRAAARLDRDPPVPRDLYPSWQSLVSHTLSYTKARPKPRKCIQCGTIEGDRKEGRRDDMLLGSSVSLEWPGASCSSLVRMTFTRSWTRIPVMSPTGEVRYLVVRSRSRPFCPQSRACCPECFNYDAISL